MQIREVLAGYFRLDGGAMFGIVPKSLWQKLNPADKSNLCLWSMRSILIESQDRKILVDTGIGDKQSEKFRSHFFPTPPDILSSLDELTLAPEDITDVFLTHLHFDHVGGAVKLEAGKLMPTFPNATYWSNEVHFDWAKKKNVREAASFLDENIIPLEKSGQLRFIDVQKEDVEWIENIYVRFLYGHTEAMMGLRIYNPADQSWILYPSDLVPSQWHIRMPYILSYDLQPMTTLSEKERWLEESIELGAELFFEHDPTLSSSRISKTENGRYILAPRSYEV